MRKPSVDLTAMREAVAKDRGFTLYRQYNEAQTAAFLHVDLSTLKRWRRKRKVPFIPFGDGVRYMGVMIADMICGGEALWQNTESSDLVNTSSASGAEAQHGLEAGMMPTPAKPNA